MNTKIQLMTGTFALVTIGAYANLAGAAVSPPAGAPAFTPADPAIVSVTVNPVTDGIGAYRFVGVATGSTTVAFAAGGVTATIDVEVLDANTPVSVAFGVGEPQPVPAVAEQETAAA